MTIEELKRRKNELHYTNEQVSDLSGVPLGTVQKIFSGATQYPRLETVEALERALCFENRFEVRESGAVYGAFTYDRQGSYTVDDYRELPDWPRHELIDGQLLIMEAPRTTHQRLLGRLYLRFAQLAASHPGCEALLSPIDVQLDCDEYTMVQPDLIVVCDEKKITDKCIFGAPDFVIEITSPSTGRRDFTLKLKKYQKAGVREYWIVDIESRTVITYLFGETNQCGLYGFDSVVPVGICEGASVDFSVVTKGL